MVLHGIVLLRIGFEISRLDELEGTLIDEVLVPIRLDVRVFSVFDCRTVPRARALSTPRRTHLPGRCIYQRVR